MRRTPLTTAPRRRVQTADIARDRRRCRRIIGESAAQDYASLSRTERPVIIVNNCIYVYRVKKGKGGPYSITERMVPELIPVLGSHPAGGVSHKPGGRLPLLSARPAVTLATLKRAVTSFAAW